MRFRFLPENRAEAEDFRRIVDERGQALRTWSYDQLLQLVDEPTAEVMVGTRQGTVSVIVEDCGAGRLKIVVQGFLTVLEPFPGWKHVALHGFYKHRVGTIDEMRAEEFYEYD